MQDVIETIRWLWAPVSALFGWVLWSLKKATASKEELAHLDGRLDRETRRIDRIETRLEALPTKDDFHDLSQGLTRLEGKYDAMQRSIESQGHSVKRIEDYLLNKDKG